MYTYAYVNATYSDLCLRECVLRVGINQSVHWSGPQCPYHYMRRAPSRSISGISCIKRTASPQCRLFLDAHILTLPACHPLWNNGHPLTSAMATVWYAFAVYRTCEFISTTKSYKYVRIFLKTVHYSYFTSTKYTSFSFPTIKMIYIQQIANVIQLSSLLL